MFFFFFFCSINRKEDALHPGRISISVWCGSTPQRPNAISRLVCLLRRRRGVLAKGCSPCVCVCVCFKKFLHFFSSGCLSGHQKKTMPKWSRRDAAALPLCGLLEAWLPEAADRRERHDGKGVEGGGSVREDWFVLIGGFSGATGRKNSCQVSKGHLAPASCFQRTK